MARLHSGWLRSTVILTLLGGLLLPASAWAEDGDTTQRENANSLDAFIAEFKGQARRAVVVAEAAGVQSKEALSALQNHLAAKTAAFRETLSGRQGRWESFRHDSAQAIDAWFNATRTWLLDLHRSAKAVFVTLGGRTQAERQSTCPEIHV